MKKFSKDLVSLSNSIDLSRFKQISKTLPSDIIKLISVGNLLVKKNQIFLLDIVRYIKSKNYSVHLNIVGDGEEKKTIANKIETLNIKDNVTLSGSKDIVEEELIKADFYVHSATYEPFGLVILEAMASRLPIIALNGSGNKDLLKNGVNGFIIDEQNPNLFGDIIIDLFCNKERYQRISEQGFQTSLKYDLPNYSKNLLKIYKS
jgi:glycosyltransferase involved in cell wall biosynthesis